MQDWAGFFFTGSNVLPAFMVLSNENAFALALLIYLGLLLAAVFAALRDKDCPARKAITIDLEKRSQDKPRRDLD